MLKIAIINYRIGNLRNVQRGFEKVGVKAEITDDRNKINEADAIILSGVGAFKDAMINLKPIMEIIIDLVNSGKPLLGICLGLQLLFEEGYEGGKIKGLKILKGKVLKLPNYVKVPHMGWNSIKIDRNNIIINSIRDGSFFYFAHSYYVKTENENVVARTEYGLKFTSIISRNNIFGTQFHPEKSGILGLRILKNFITYIKC